MRLQPGSKKRPEGSRQWGSLLALSALVSAVLAPQLSGQSSVSRRSVPTLKPIESTVAEVPFGPGEEAEYQVKLGPLSVGSGIMQVVSVEPVRGRPSYYLSWKIKGGLPLARVDDHFESWIDIETLSTLRSIRAIREVRYRANRFYEIYPDEGFWERTDTGQIEELATELPLDDISFIYFARTMPLEVGETYAMDRYFRSDRNPVILQVLRRETIEVPAGTFNTIVVRPIIKAGGLFGEGGEAEVYFTDDDRRILVKLSSKMPVVGSLSLHLRSYQEGASMTR